MTPFLLRLVDSARGAAQPAVRPRIPLPFEYAAPPAGPDTDRMEGPDPAPHSRPGDAIRVRHGTMGRVASPGHVHHTGVQEVGAGDGAADSLARPAARRDSPPRDHRAGASGDASGADDGRSARDSGSDASRAPAARIAKAVASASPPALEATAPLARAPEAAPRPAAIRHTRHPPTDSPVTDAGLVRPAHAAEPSAPGGGAAAGDGVTPDAHRRIDVRPRLASMAPARTAEPRAYGSAEAPVVHITIGRIDVRAVHDAPRPAAPPKRPSAAPRLSLDEYLRQRSGGER